MTTTQVGSTTDEIGILRIVTRLDTRALRAEQAHAKLEQELRSTQATLKRTTEELDQVARLADIFYEVSQRMGTIVDHFLKERYGTRANGQDPETMKAMLDLVLNEHDNVQPSNVCRANGGSSEGEDKGPDVSSSNT